MARILVVEDDPNLREAIQIILTRRGHEVLTAGSGEQAISEQGRAACDALVLDITLPGMDGVATLAAIKAFTPDVVAVFITAHASIASAVEAMRIGGYDYLPKPFDNDELALRVERAIEHRRLVTRVRDLESDLDVRTAFSSIVGQSAVLQEAVRRLGRVAATGATVLLSGETGTGKELAARSIHRRSERAGGPFIAVNCGAIPATLAESELFGHERGAFTDARAERRGLFEQAHGGTVFLDEIGDLSLDLQVKLLRVLQEHELVRVGGSKVIPIDVRVIAASNRDLAQEVSARRFREDLYWRLKVFSIEMPPLRQRREDVPLLVEHLLDQVNAECRSRITRLSPALLLRLQTHSWPGNVRELISLLKCGAIMADGETIDLEHVPEMLLTTPPTHARADVLPVPDASNLDAALAETERRLILAAIRRFEGNRKAAAVALGISRRTLYNKIADHKISVAANSGDVD